MPDPVSPVSMIFVFLNSDIPNGHWQGLQAFMVYGYVFALVFSLFALKNRWFLLLSLLGWLVFIGTDLTDTISARISYSESCLEMRQSGFCDENKDGSMDCHGGKYNGGFFPFVCAGRPR